MERCVHNRSLDSDSSDAAWFLYSVKHLYLFDLSIGPIYLLLAITANIFHSSGNPLLGPCIRHVMSGNVDLTSKVPPWLRRTSLKPLS